MFKHIFIAQTKLFFRNKESILWNLLFPFAMVTLYYVAFHNIADTENFKIDPVPVAVEKTDQTIEGMPFRQFLESEGESHTMDGDQILYDTETNKNLVPILVDRPAGEKLVESGKVDGMITYEKGKPISYVLGPRDIENYRVIMVKAMMDYYQQRENTVTRIINEAVDRRIPISNDQVSQMISTLNGKDYLMTLKTPVSNVSKYTVFYLAILAYICIAAVAKGIDVVGNVEAVYSPVSMRAAISPTSKRLRFIAVMVASLVMAVLLNLLTFGYMLLLKMPVGDSYGAIVGIVVLGTFVGFFMGTAVGSLLPGKMTLKNGLGIILPLAMGFMSGMMSVEVKYAIDTHLPVVQKFNPLNAIVEGLNALRFYETMEIYSHNMVYLGGLLVAFIALTMIGLRRADYESL